MEGIRERILNFLGLHIKILCQIFMALPREVSLRRTLNLANSLFVQGILVCAVQRARGSRSDADG